MFCTSCGKQFDDRNRFCPYCGVQVPGALHPPAAPAQPQYQQPQYQQPQYQQSQYQQPQYQQPQYRQPQYQQPVQAAPEKPKKHTGLVVGLILGGIALILGVLAALITFAHLFGGWKGIFGSKSETAPNQAVASAPGFSPAESIPSFPVQSTEVDTAPETTPPTPALDETYDVIIWTGDDRNAWGVIGSICGTNWDTDFPMTEVANGVYESAPMYLYASEELKVRQGGSWDNNYGTDGRDGANLVISSDGSYVIRLDLNWETIEAIRQ